MGRPRRWAPDFLVVGLLVTLVAGAPLPARGEALDQHGKAHAWKADGVHTVIDFAASWCEPCRKTLPVLQTYADEHPERRILVVSVDETRQGRDRLIEDLGLRLPVLWDEGYALAEHFKPAGMPATFVVDPHGTVIYSHVGSKEEDWRALVEFLETLPE